MTDSRKVLDLKADGWTQDTGPADQIGECTAETGCTRAGRWTGPGRHGAWCTQHAHQALMAEPEWARVTR